MGVIRHSKPVPAKSGFRSAALELHPRIEAAITAVYVFAGRARADISVSQSVDEVFLGLSRVGAMLRPGSAETQTSAAATL